ncbi:hypothetical protein LS482_13370 [Sinomicrobium kalidii]|uniref:hypothetical protein n=1 Tax=Sinomicrobium kalidii TaxID=2900738 RepID=UPI001E3F5A1D|nr:hypothetical protein [Sinomicrobium kalidii]UGU14686.1 hypothetical protein LS482_13370 [Sinomicrobium kalidii]
MKAATVFIAMMSMAVLLGCVREKEKSTGELLKDQATQNEIMETISNDHEMMTNMMEHIVRNDHALRMIISNTTVIRQMIQGDQMMSMMMESPDPDRMHTMMQRMLNMAASDTAACRMMGNTMIENDHMKNMMHGLMNKKSMAEKRKTMQMHMEKYHPANNTP